MKDVSTLINKLTPEDKLKLLGGVNNFYTKSIDMLEIPSIRMSDASIGIRAMSGGQPIESVAYPASICLAASWNIDLAEQMGKALALDAKRFGIQVLLGPGVNLYRAAMCGRNAEYMGEDPFLAGSTACAFIKGVQSKGIAAVIKHFAANNSEYDRFLLSSDIDERTLREVYLKPFEMAVKQADAAGVMGSYNRVNGVYGCQHEWLIKQVLKGEWRFEGVVISDWGAVHDGVEAALAGLDIEMPFAKHMNPQMLAAHIKSGGLDQSVIDDKVVRILRLYERFGYFDQENLKPDESIDIKINRQIALKVTQEGIVLLKNNGLLPLETGKASRIAVIGPNAHPAVTGCGGSSYVVPERAISVFEGIKNIAGRDVTVSLNDFVEFENSWPRNISCLKDDDIPLSYIERLKLVAANSDAVVLCVGFNDGAYFEGEACDRTYEMHENCINLINLLSEINENVIVVLNAGGNADIHSWADKVKAIIHAWYPGQEGGTAIAEIIFGNVCPSGKLPITIEKKWEDSPSFNSYYDENGDHRVRYSEGIFIGYRHFDKNGIEPLYPFGFGLSYTSFKYEDLSAKNTGNGSLQVRFSITNTGEVLGAEVAQLYVRDIQCRCERPLKELKGYAKVLLNPSEKKEVCIELDRKAFEYFNPVQKKWQVEPGEFIIMIGSSSAHIYLQANIEYPK